MKYINILLVALLSLSHLHAQNNICDMDINVTLSIDNQTIFLDSSFNTVIKYIITNNSDKPLILDPSDFPRELSDGNGIFFTVFSITDRKFVLMGNQPDVITFETNTIRLAKGESYEYKFKGNDIFGCTKN